MKYLKSKDKKVFLSVYILPGSSKTEIIGLYDDALKIKLKSSPVNNQANKELIEFLSKKLKISKSNIEITSGSTQKRKLLTLNGCTSEYVLGIFSL